MSSSLGEGIPKETSKSSSTISADLKVVYQQLVKQVHVDDITTFTFSNLKRIGKKFPGLENSKFLVHFIDDDNNKSQIKSDKDLTRAFIISESQGFLKAILSRATKTSEEESENGSDFELIDHSEEEDNNIIQSESESEEEYDDDNKSILLQSEEGISQAETFAQQPKIAVNSEEVEESKAQESDVIPSSDFQPFDSSLAVVGDLVENTSDEKEITPTIPSYPNVNIENIEEEQRKIQSTNENIQKATYETLRNACPQEAASLHKALKTALECYSQNSDEQSEQSIPRLREALSIVLSDPVVVGELQQTINTQQVKDFIVDVFSAEKNGDDVWLAATSHLVPILDLVSKVMQKHTQLFALVPIIAVFIMDLMKEKPVTKMEEETKKSKQAPVHRHVLCNGCSIKNPNYYDYIVGVRYKSAVVDDFDLCDDCEKEGLYIESHGPFLKIYTPSQAPESILCVLKDDPRNRNTGFGQFAQNAPSAFVDINGNDAQDLYDNLLSVHANATSNAAVAATQCLDDSFAQAISQSILTSASTCQLENTLSCHNHHQLKSFEIPYFGFRCDSCLKRPNVGEIMLGCRPCNYDICSACSSKVTDTKKITEKFNCPGKHNLKRHLASHSGFSCDNCSLRPGLNAVLYGCRLCNFDICVNCYDKFTNKRDLTRKVPEPLKHQMGAKFVQDKTFKDGSLLSPGQVFIKTWKLKNCSRTDPWPEGCRLVSVGGDRLGCPIDGFPVSSVGPNEIAEISVKLTAPAKAGRVIGYFRLFTKNNQRFGDRVWADICVEGTIGEVIAASIALPLRSISDQLVSRAQELEIGRILTSATSKLSQSVSDASSQIEDFASSINEEDSQAAFNILLQDSKNAEAERKYSVELNSLLEMGFSNIDQNLELLERFNGNLPDVLSELTPQ